MLYYNTPIYIIIMKHKATFFPDHRRATPNLIELDWVIN